MIKIERRGYYRVDLANLDIACYLNNYLKED